MHVYHQHGVVQGVLKLTQTMKVTRRNKESNAGNKTPNSVKKKKINRKHSKTSNKT